MSVCKDKEEQVVTKLHPKTKRRIRIITRKIVCGDTREEVEQ